MGEKTTNVSPHDLNYDSYEAEKYESDIVRSIPGYNELHEKIFSIVKEFSENHNIKKILDLGVGTGITSEKILSISPSAKLVALDFSETMLNGARKRLSKYDAKFIRGDYSEIEFENNFDIVISVIGIHHQNTEGKQKLFRKIFNSLNKDGLFLFGDLMTYRNREKAQDNDSKHFNHLEKNAEDEKSRKEWLHHHKNLNILSPIEDQVDWLKESGFPSVEIVFTCFNTVLILARK